MKSISKIASPCISVCKLENGHCVGCGRSQDEIREWFYVNDQRKKEIRDQSAERIPSRMRRVRRNNDCTG